MYMTVMNGASLSVCLHDICFGQVVHPGSFNQGFLVKLNFTYFCTMLI